MTPTPNQRWLRRASTAGHTETVRSVTTTANGRVLIAMWGRAGTLDLDAFHAAYEWQGAALETKEKQP